MGEFLGWLFQGVWAVAVAVLVLRAVGLPRWFGGLGLALAAVWAVVIPVTGLLRWSALNNAVGQPVYSLWFVWLLVLGVLLLRRRVAAERRGRPGSRRAEAPVDVDDHDDPAGVRPRRPVPHAVPPFRLGHGLRVREHAGSPLEGQPAPPVHLAHRRPPTARRVARLHRVPARDDADHARVGVPREADGDDVRAAVRPQRGQRGQVALAEEGAGGVGGQVEGHAPRVPDPDGARAGPAAGMTDVPFRNTGCPARMPP